MIGDSEGQSASGKHTGIWFLNKSFLSLLTIVGTDHISGCIKSGLCLAEHLQVVLLKPYLVYNKINVEFSHIDTYYFCLAT